MCCLFPQCIKENEIKGQSEIEDREREEASDHKEAYFYRGGTRWIFLVYTYVYCAAPAVSTKILSTRA